MSENYSVNLSFQGKIAIITNSALINEDNLHSADRLIEKYGNEKIVHVTWPDNFVRNQKQMIETVDTLAQDSDIKVMIINHALPGSNAAVDKLKQTRKDIYIVYCSIHEPAADAVQRASLVLGVNELDMGPAIIQQAVKQGAKVFVHYSFPRHTALDFIATRCKLMRQECLRAGILFIEAAVLDPAGEAGVKAARDFITSDVPKMTARYGEDTSFFCTTCTLQAPLIKAVIDTHAIFSQPCCPSPYNGFTEALGIDTGNGLLDLSSMISEASRIAAEKNMTDRLSAWPVTASTMFTNAGAEYAVKWLNGDAPRVRIDTGLLMDCMNDYVMDVIGEESGIFMCSASENGIEFENYKLIHMSYLDF